METIAITKGNKFYINNQFLFEIKYVRKWLFAKEKYQLIDAFDNLQLFFYVTHGLGCSKIVFIQNNLSRSYEFVQNKNSFYWTSSGNKYYIKQPFSFSYRIEFYKDDELIGSSLKNSFWKSYLDEMQFSFKDDVTIEEIELYLILYVMHSVYFGFGD